MNQSRKMWVSAAVVAAVVAGGVYVAASASAGALESVRGETRAVVKDVTTPPPSGKPSSDEKVPEFVVSHELNADPGEVAKYWTPERLKDAEPMPMPVVIVAPEE
ncbi:hypothetical protein [Nonomuraea soli]|uniref:Uncharacterized protein n=1 Tax=Nonomuraea soli TaxID=1032476 RepID=A0A7W0HV35_9ACTN|nr:hypothetical protein [Nonomuraea soli]MBA2896366.1 hypothetical protein [Nonomuraea soli]